MTEQEFDELCDLIAEMIFDKMKKDAAAKAAAGGPQIEREEDGKAHSE
jgi:hypothetical protein